MLKTLTATKARADFFHLVNDSIKSHRTYAISAREGRAILLSEEEYDALVESLELLSTPGVLKGVLQAKKEIAKGQTYSIKEVFGHA